MEDYTDIELGDEINFYLGIMPGLDYSRLVKLIEERARRKADGTYGGDLVPTCPTCNFGAEGILDVGVTDSYSITSVKDKVVYMKYEEQAEEGTLHFVCEHGHRWLVSETDYTALLK